MVQKKNKKITKTTVGSNENHVKANLKEFTAFLMKVNKEGKLPYVINSFKKVARENEDLYIYFPNELIHYVQPRFVIAGICGGTTFAAGVKITALTVSVSKMAGSYTVSIQFISTNAKCSLEADSVSLSNTTIGRVTNLGVANRTASTGISATFQGVHPIGAAPKDAITATVNFSVTCVSNGWCDACAPDPVTGVTKTAAV